MYSHEEKHVTRLDILLIISIIVLCGLLLLFYFYLDSGFKSLVLYYSYFAIGGFVALFALIEALQGFRKKHMADMAVNGIIEYIHSRIGEAEYLVAMNNKSKAAEIYKEVRNVYFDLSDDEKKEVNARLHSLYNSIKS